jgi:hypothetical protein
MKNIDLQSSLDFQEVFFHNNISSPYEFVDTWGYYYPLTVIGEIGTLLNNYCKSVRSPNNYKHDIENDCADIFVFFLTLGMMIERKTEYKVFSKIQSEWDTPVEKLEDEKDFIQKLKLLTDKVFLLTNDDREKYYNSDSFLELFILIKEISVYTTSKDWQEVINTFHLDTLEKFTTFNRYTPDLWYMGSCFVDFNKLLTWIQENDATLPKKRVLFFERMKKLQESLIT